jgi:hypothetical protein
MHKVYPDEAGAVVRGNENIFMSVRVDWRSLSLYQEVEKLYTRVCDLFEIGVKCNTVLVSQDAHDEVSQALNSDSNTERSSEAGPSHVSMVRKPKFRGSEVE